MGLGFGLLSAQLRTGESDWYRAYDETIQLAVAAEQMGFSSIWTTEHHFVDDGYMPSLLVVSAALAAATSTIAIGTGVILAPLHDPIRLAEDAATVQLLSKGRLILGLGLGSNPAEFEALGAAMSERGRTMSEILQILPKAWSGDPFRHDGMVFDIPKVGVRPKPQVRIPIVIGGSAEPAVRRAARLADGLFSNATPDRFVQQVAWVKEELERENRPIEDFRFLYYAVLFPGASVESASRAALPHLWPMSWKYSDMEQSATRSLPVIEAPPVPSDIQQIDRGLFAGSPDKIVEDLQAIREQVGVPVEFVARSYFHTMDIGEQLDLMDQLVTGVSPHL